MQKRSAEGVLKRNSSAGHNNAHHIKWDEENLKKHEQLQGTYEKITEPKTPYSERVEFEAEDKKEMVPITQEDLKLDVHLHEAELNAEKNQHNKPDLKLLNEQLMKEAARVGDEADDEDKQSQEKRKQHEEFLRKRADHYSEFKKIQEAKKKHLWEEDD